MINSFVKDFKKELFSTNATNFKDKALALFQYQAENNLLYKQYISLIKRCIPEKIVALHEIPFLPIELFKYHKIITDQPIIETIFESSGTTGQLNSKHYVADIAFYQAISQSIFEQMYGNLKDFVILALLPSYVERGNSSLVLMIKHFMEQTQDENSGFYLHNTAELAQKLIFLQQNSSKKILLIGVTFALIDFALQHPINLSQVIVMETGGMKGRKTEMIRTEVHEILKKQFNIAKVHSEYGMTELLSQAYSQGEEIFTTPPMMQILLRDKYDFFEINPEQKRGIINVIDLANADSCAFIATQDIGEKLNDRQFKVLGRNEMADVRGCNLMLLS